MKEQIEKLIELAKEYHAFAMKVGMPDTWNYLRGIQANYNELKSQKEGSSIGCYLAERGKVWVVEFGEVQIKDYSKIIELPFSVSEDYLENIYKDASEFLHSTMQLISDKLQNEAVIKRQDEIKKLEDELAELKAL